MRCTELSWVIVVGFLVSLAATESTTQAQKSPEPEVSLSADPNDWPTYNHDVIGTRCNTGEKVLGKDNVGHST